MKFNSFLEDINDEEDYHQYGELLKLAGVPPEDIDTVLDKRREQFKRKAERVEQAAIERATTSGECGSRKQDLGFLMNPDSPTLEEVDVYHRYVLWLLSQATNTDVSEIIRMPRNTLWRWMKKHDYPLRFDRDSSE